jgi:putative endonuclease
MFYVYLIKSIPFPNQRYVGFSENYKRRLESHNFGQSIHTNRFKPWELICYFAFKDVQSAKDFEKYLKTGSGSLVELFSRNIF